MTIELVLGEIWRRKKLLSKNPALLGLKDKTFLLNKFDINIENQFSGLAKEIFKHFRNVTKYLAEDTPMKLNNLH